MQLFLSNPTYCFFIQLWPVIFLFYAVFSKESKQLSGCWSIRPVRRSWGPRACSAWKREFRRTSQQPQHLKGERFIITETGPGSSLKYRAGRWQIMDTNWNRHFDWKLFFFSPPWEQLGRGTACPERLQSLSMEVFRIQLVKTLSYLIWTQSWTLLWGGGSTGDLLKSLSTRINDCKSRLL